MARAVLSGSRASSHRILVQQSADQPLQLRAQACTVQQQQSTAQLSGHTQQAYAAPKAPHSCWTAAADTYDTRQSKAEGFAAASCRADSTQDQRSTHTSAGTLDMTALRYSQQTK
jgi:hypothetical protein